MYHLKLKEQITPRTFNVCYSDQHHESFEFSLQEIDCLKEKTINHCVAFDLINLNSFQYINNLRFENVERVFLTISDTIQYSIHFRCFLKKIKNIKIIEFGFTTFTSEMCGDIYESLNKSIERLFFHRCQRISLIFQERYERVKEIHFEFNEIDDIWNVDDILPLKTISEKPTNYLNEIYPRQPCAWTIIVSLNEHSYKVVETFANINQDIELIIYVADEDELKDLIKLLFYFVVIDPKQIKCQIERLFLSHKKIELLSDYIQNRTFRVLGKCMNQYQNISIDFWREVLNFLFMN